MKFFRSIMSEGLFDIKDFQPHSGLNLYNKPFGMVGCKT